MAAQVFQQVVASDWWWLQKAAGKAAQVSQTGDQVVTRDFRYRNKVQKPLSRCKIPGSRYRIAQARGARLLPRMCQGAAHNMLTT